MLEVVYSSNEPVSHERKRDFARDVERILGDVLGTPRGRMRLFFIEIVPQDSGEGLLRDDAEEEGSADSR